MVQLLFSHGTSFSDTATTLQSARSAAIAVSELQVCAMQNKFLQLLTFTDSVQQGQSKYHDAAGYVML